MDKNSPHELSGLCLPVNQQSEPVSVCVKLLPRVPLHHATGVQLWLFLAPVYSVLCCFPSSLFTWPLMSLWVFFRSSSSAFRAGGVKVQAKTSAGNMKNELALNFKEAFILDRTETSRVIEASQQVISCFYFMMSLSKTVCSMTDAHSLI